MANLRVFAPLRLIVFLAFALALTACETAAVQIVPTDLPTSTPTFTPSPSRTPGPNATPTITPTLIPMSPTGGPSPTSLFGPTSTPAPNEPTPTRSLNPNAPRIEFFTSDVIAAAPGSSITLFWSTRNIASASIYRVDPGGQRSQVWNVPADGRLSVPTRRSDRGQVDFVLSIGDGPLATEQTLAIPLSCPDQWFFIPSPEECPVGPAQESALKEEAFERGRMVYIQQTNQVYVLFNDGFEPAWISFDNRYDPAIHPESEETFLPPPGFVQPIAVLGFAWRRDVVRNRLGLALQPESTYEGSYQTANTLSGDEHLYVSSTDGTVLQLLPGGSAWQIITPP
jgi:hypothetical protein